MNGLWRTLATALVFSVLPLTTFADDPPRYNIESERRTILEQYLRDTEEVERAVREGRLSQEAGARRLQDLNRGRFELAKTKAAEYGPAYEDLLEEARRIRAEGAQRYTQRTGRPDPGWRDPGNTGTPLNNPHSRGIFGDQDLTFASEADRAALVEAARRQGYTVKGRLGDGYVMIEELDIAAHGPTVRPANPVSPQGRLQTAELVQGHETFATKGSRQLWLPEERSPWTQRDTLGQVADNIKKVEHDLRVDPGTLRDWGEREVWAQNLSKGTGRAMDAAGKSEQQLEAALAAARQEGQSASVIHALEEDLAFRKQLAVLKTRMDPRAAGLVPPGASAEETQRILREFQARAVKEFHGAYRTGVEANQKLLVEMDARIATLKAGGQTAEADALLLERAAIADADAQAIQYLATNPKDKGRVLAEIVSGTKLEAVSTSNGLRYRTASGELLTEEEVATIARRAMNDARGGAPSAGRTMSKAEIANAVLMFVVLPAIHGTQQELDDAAREGRDPKKMAMMLNSFWEATQIPEIQRSYRHGEDISRQEIRKELDRIQAMIARGEQPSAINSAIRAVLLSIGRVTGITDIVEAGNEISGLLSAEWTDLQGPPGDVSALVRARSGKMLAFVDRETGEIERMRGQIAELVDDAEEPMERMRKAELELYSMKNRLGRVRQNIRDLESHCLTAEHRRSQFDAEEPELAVDRDRAMAAFRKLEMFVESACRPSAAEDVDAAPAGDTAEVNAIAAGLRQTSVDATDGWIATAESLLETARDLEEELEALDNLRTQADPRVLLAMAPEVLEEARSAGEDAAGFLEPAMLLTQKIKQREKKIRLYLGMLEDAQAEQDNTRQARARLESVIDSVINLAPEVAGNLVNSKVEDAYASFEEMQNTLGLESLQSEWDAACSSEIAMPDIAALEADLQRAKDLKQDADRLYEQLVACSSQASSRVFSEDLYVSRDEAGYERVSNAVAGQKLFIQIDFGITHLSRSDTISVTLEVSLPDGRRVLLSPPSVPVRPEQEEGYSTTAPITLPEDVPPGACHVTGRIRHGGLVISAGEASFVIEEFRIDVGEVVVSASQAGPPEQKFAPGDAVHAAVEVALGQSGSDVQVQSEWVITYPDGRTKTLTPSELSFSETQSVGASGMLTVGMRTSGTTPLGLYRMDMVARVGEREIASRSTTFEIVPLFENPTILISDTDEGLDSVQSLRPGDPFFVITDMIYNSSDPNRVVHISVELTGPDARISALDIEGDQSPARGAFRTGAARQVPAQIMEGTYTAVVTLDGGHDQVLRLQESFRIVYPVQFRGIWSRDGNDPPALKAHYANGDPREWFMQYQFVDVRPGDQFSSAFMCSFNGYQVEPLSSEIFGPDTPSASGSPQTRDFGMIPLDAPAGIYDLQGIVWYNDIGYLSPESLFKVGQDPTVTITSPQPGFEVDEKVLVVTGTCADRNLNQAQMFTNGEAIPIKLADGRFSAKTVLRPGRNEIRVVAENEGGTSEAEVWGTANIRAAALKIVLIWEANGPDIDLWVTDPQGVVTNYHKQRPAEGRNLDVDDTSGPGMETYTVEVPLRGRYDVAVHYYAAKGWQGAVPFRLQVTTWEATYNENHSGRTGTLYTAASDREEQGAVVHFSIGLQ